MACLVVIASRVGHVLLEDSPYQQRQHNKTMNVWRTSLKRESLAIRSHQGKSIIPPSLMVLAGLYHTS